jgi:hypothetical protein
LLDSYGPAGSPPPPLSASALSSNEVGIVTGGADVDTDGEEESEGDALADEDCWSVGGPGPSGEEGMGLVDDCDGCADGRVDRLGPLLTTGFVVGFTTAIPLGLIEMPGTGVDVVGTGPSCTVPLDRCSTGRDGVPGLLDTNVSHVFPASLNTKGAALLLV